MIKIKNSLFRNETFQNKRARSLANIESINTFEMSHFSQKKSTECFSRMPNLQSMRITN